MATRRVLRIFISSTAVDLRDYRDKVRDAVLRLENLPIAMETFSASGQPANERPASASATDASRKRAVHSNFAAARSSLIFVSSK